MRMSRAGEYAIRCMFYLAKQGVGKTANRKAVAAEMAIPDQFLGKIAQQLAKAGLIEIVQGPKGGFRLTRTPDAISMLDVIEAVIGPVFLNDCVLRPDSCHRSPFCSVHSVWEQVCGQMKVHLQEVRFSDLVRDEVTLLGK